MKLIKVIIKSESNIIPNKKGRIILVFSKNSKYYKFYNLCGSLEAGFRKDCFMSMEELAQEVTHEKN